MKNTNRLFFALLATAALLFAAGCSSDDDDTISASDLAGTTWAYTLEAPDYPADTTYYTLSFSSDGAFDWTYVNAWDSSSTKDFVSGNWSLSGSMLELEASEIEDYSVKELLEVFVETAEEMTSSSSNDDWDDWEKELFEMLAEAAKKDTENPTFVYNGTCSSNAITITGLAINGVTIPYFLGPNGWNDSSITFSKQ